jgi:hypothetical protein
MAATNAARTSQVMNHAIATWDILATVDRSQGMYGLARASVWFALIFLLVATAVALVRKYQRDGTLWKRLSDSTADDGQDPSELLSKFREMHSRGTLSDTEYRTIRMKLASQIKAQANASRPIADE